MKYSKLSDWTIKKILRCFCNELTAVQTAKQLHLNRNTIDRYYDIFRRRIAAYQEIQKQKFRGSIEIDESHFGSRHRGDPRGRSAAAKIPVVASSSGTASCILKSYRMPREGRLCPLLLDLSRNPAPTSTPTNGKVTTGSRSRGINITASIIPKNS